MLLELLKFKLNLKIIYKNICEEYIRDNSGEKIIKFIQIGMRFC